MKVLILNVGSRFLYDYDLSERVFLRKVAKSGANSIIITEWPSSIHAFTGYKNIYIGDCDSTICEHKYIQLNILNPIYSKVHIKH